MDSEKIETAANINGANLEKKIVGKTSAQRQKEYRERKKLQKQLQGPKKVPKTNAQCQQQYRLKQKQRLQLNETLNLARKQSDAVRAKRYRDKLKLKKLRGEFDSVLFSKKDSFENREVNYLQNTNPTSFTSFEVPINGHNECSTLNVPLHHEIDIAGVGCYEGLGTEDSTPDLPSLNGDDSCSQDRFSVTVKEEPVSDNEEHVAPDMSLDCMLCTKVFNSVSGLKAHVIAQHSYKTVKRKAANEASPTKKQKQNYVCETCRRSFSTSTDLMVHETCHNKSVCYGCNEKFDTFEMVMQHRLTCKAVNGREQVPVKTLEDVQRPNRPASNESDVPEPQLKCEYCDEKFSDDYYMKIHLEIHHRAGRRPSASEMEVEALESLFSERA